MKEVIEALENEAQRHLNAASKYVQDARFHTAAAQNAEMKADTAKSNLAACYEAIEHLKKHGEHHG